MTYWRAICETLKQVASNRSIAGTLLIAAVLYSYYYPVAYTSQIATRLPIAVVDEDQSALSRKIIRNTMAMRAIEIDRFSQSLEEAKKAISRREIDGILLIPDGFERNALGQRQGTLLLYGNGAFLVRNSAVLGGLTEDVQAIAMAVIGDELKKAGVAGRALADFAVPVRLVTRPLFNIHEGYGSYVVPGVGPLIVQQSLLFGILMLMGYQREKSLAATGKPPPAIGAREFFGRFTAFTFIGVLNMLYFIGFAYWFHDYPRGGNLPGMLLVAVLFVSACVAASLFIGTFFDREERSMQMLGVTSIPILFLAGLSWPKESIPWALTTIAKLLPSTEGITASIKVNQLGATIAETMPEIIGLLALIAFYGVLAWMRLSKPVQISTK